MDRHQARDTRPMTLRKLKQGYDTSGAMLGQWACGDAIISLTPTGRFEVKWPGNLDGDETADTLDEAKKKVDERARKLLKKKTIEHKLITGKGTPVTRTGIHVGHGASIVKGADGKKHSDKWGGDRDYYVDTPHTRDLIQTFNAAKRRVKEIEEELDAFKVQMAFSDHAYKSRFDDNEYVAAMDAAEAEYNEMRAMALELGGGDDGE